MNDYRVVIEVDGEPAGLVVSERRGYRFYAAGSSFAGLEQRIFRSPGHAENACRRAVIDSGAPRNYPVG